MSVFAPATSRKCVETHAGSRPRGAGIALGSAVLSVLISMPIKAAPPDYPAVMQLSTHPELPDPLIASNNTRVTSAEQWKTERRPELKALFSHYMYGASPPAPDKVVGTLDREDREALGGKATLREISIAFGPREVPPIHLLLVIPNTSPLSGKFPVFVGTNFYGNHTVLRDPKVALATGWVPDRAMAKENKATDAGRGFQADAWQVERLIDRGYALATYYAGDIAPDHPGRADGIFPHYPKYDFGAIAAWAWGLSRIADDLAGVPEIDPSKMIVIGHSRLGKAALVAGAFDDRFAVVIAHQAGTGGSAPSRGPIGETVTQINTNFPHWFNSGFKTFNGHPEKLPFDQNGLVSLVAPRPVLFTNATLDVGANPEGQFRVLKGAESVYTLLGAKGVGADRAPETGKLINATLGYAIRPGKHSMAPEDWPFFLEFADSQLKK